MHSVARSDRALLWYNNHLLFWLAIVPFVTGFIGDYPTQPLVVALYGFVLMMAAAAFSMMAHHVFFRGRLVHDHVSHLTRKKEFRHALIGVACYAVSVVAAFLSP